MKTLAFVLVAALLSTALYVSAPLEAPAGWPDGICVVEFNAGFNSQNSVSWIERLSDCESLRVDISKSPDLQREHKIVVVPTLVIFNDGEEENRFQANIMMAMEATEEEVQDAVDEILMSSF